MRSNQNHIGHIPRHSTNRNGCISTIFFLSIFMDKMKSINLTTDVWLRAIFNFYLYMYVCIEIYVYLILFVIVVVLMPLYARDSAMFALFAIFACISVSSSHFNLLLEIYSIVLFFAPLYRILVVSAKYFSSILFSAPTRNRLDPRQWKI